MRISLTLWVEQTQHCLEGVMVREGELGVNEGVGRILLGRYPGPMKLEAGKAT